PYYVANTTVKSKCHGGHPKNKNPRFAGTWGTSISSCDSPMSLVNATFNWLERNWKEGLDFIIWTGDNSRHDNDNSKPRTSHEIFELNRMIASKFLETFSTRGIRGKNKPRVIPIVPSIGNHDIFPNNILLPGPNDILANIHKIWEPFIPGNQRATFLKGGYFYNEVIPNKLMVISLNTLYFYNSNTAVSGCKAPNQPGTIEMEWLTNVLKRARKRGMRVYLIGHVAPRKKQYTKSCYRAYKKISIDFHDLILGHYYGHSNMDHFFFIGAKNDLGKFKHYDNYDKEQFKTLVNKSPSKINKYLAKLYNHYRSVPPLTKGVGKEYAVIHINPSIIPVFYPALRIFKYNTTEGQDPNAPSHINTFLTPLGYTQYFINLTVSNLFPDEEPEYVVEYSTWVDYHMKDLTVPSWINLARKVTNQKLSQNLRNVLWKKIEDNLVVGTKPLIETQNIESLSKEPEDFYDF
ncbi:17426_t:CDS:2, partial [Racocetra fulgida]